MSVESHRVSAVESSHPFDSFYFRISLPRDFSKAETSED